MAHTFAASRPQPCNILTFEDHRYTVCRAALAHYSVRLFWKKPDGSAYTYLSALPETDGNGNKLAFAFNGGMFDPGFRPVGLYIEGGREIVRANTNSGPGNFHLKPNGVFYVNDREAGVMETGAFLVRHPNATFATQSGPMLVLNGKPHPKLLKANASAKFRDGVCVTGGNTVAFAISEDEVSFAAFQRLFLSALECRNALFLDGGSAPALYQAPLSRGGNRFTGLGPMIAVYERKTP